MTSKFFVHYFTTEAHYKYLKLSVQSWSNLPHLNHIAAINIFMDCSHPFSEAESESIRQTLSIPVNFIPTDEPMSHRGLNVVQNELRAFVRSAKIAQPDDWIVKVDSDVVVTSSLHAFQYAQRSTASMFGNGNNKFIQGGAYFIRMREVYRLFSAPLTEDYYVRRNSAKCPEDKVITEQMRRGGGRISRVHIAWNCPSINELASYRPLGSFLHFMGKSKRNMEQGFRIESERKLTISADAITGRRLV